MSLAIQNNLRMCEMLWGVGVGEKRNTDLRSLPFKLARRGFDDEGEDKYI